MSQPPQGPFNWMKPPAPPSGIQMLNHPQMPIKPPALKMSNQVNSFNNTYGAINEIEKKRSLVVMNALTKEAQVDSVTDKKP